MIQASILTNTVGQILGQVEEVGAGRQGGGEGGVISALVIQLDLSTVRETLRMLQFRTLWADCVY